MALFKRAHSGFHNWLYLTPTGFGMAQVRARKGALPLFQPHDWHDDQDPLQRAEALADWVAEHAQGAINLLLGDGYYQLLLVDVPDVPADEVEAALRLKAAELLPYDLDDASLEVILLPAQAYHGRTRMAFIVATEQQPLRQWALALARRGLTLTNIDIDQLQLRNLALRASSQQQNGLLHLRPDHCQLLLIYQHELVLSRRFDIGYDDLGVAVEGQADIQRDSLVLELRRSFDYYESQLGLGSIDQLNLTGWPGAHDMIDDLGAKLGMRFMPLRLEDHLQLAHPELPAPLLPLAGAAFRGASS